MNRLLALTTILIFCSWSLHGQKKPLAFFVAYEKDKAYVLLVDVPTKMKGFNVYRKVDGEFQLLTEEPIEPERDAAAFHDMLGDDYNWIRNAVKAENELQVMRRVQSDRGVAFAFSLTSLKIARALGRLFVDSTAREGSEYTYRIAYIDYGNKEFGRTDRTMRLKSSVPSGPSELKAEASDAKVKLAWQYLPYSGDPNDLAVGFNIYREEENTPPKKVNAVLVLRQDGQLSRIDDEVENGKSYTYTVRAVDFIGRESDPSEPVAALPKDMKAPAVPTGLAATAQEGRIVLDWKMGLESDISHYDVYRGLSSQGDFTRINLRPIPVSVPTFVDTSVIFGPYYFYKVKATDKSGNESKFSAAIPARPGDNTAPMVPLELTSSVVGRSVRLNWKPSPSRDALGYYVYRGQGSGNLLRMVSTPLPKDSVKYTDAGFNLRGLNPGASYYYAVSSVDSAHNESARTTVAVRIPDTEQPSPPFDARANPDKYGIIELGWQPSPSLDVMEFRVYRAQETQPQQRIAVVRGFVWRDSNVVRGVRYEYQVTAVDTSGNESVKSPVVKATSSSIYLPPAPGAVQAIATTSGVALTWTSVDSRELRGYNIYRSSQSSGVSEKLNVDVVKATIYTDPQGKSGMYYKVTAVSTSGHENTSGKPVRAEEKRQ